MVTGPENAVSQVERLHSEATPGQGGRVCVIVADDDGNGRQPPVFIQLFSIAKDPHTFKNYRPARNLKSQDYLFTS